MKKIYVFLAVVAALLFSSVKSANASHFASCELTYACLGGNDYVVTVTFYRDCSGVYAAPSVNINFKSSCQNMIVTFPQIGNPVNITTTCPTAPNSCQNPSSSLYGLQKVVYQNQITLTPCSDWVISYMSGARNPSSNLLNPTAQNWYVFATLNNLAAPCNSSPQFSNNPSSVVCQAQNFHYNHGAIDPDGHGSFDPYGDSLVYSLITPYNGVNSSGVPTPVNYLPGYSGAYPLPSNPPLTVDPINGDIFMNCPTSFVAALAIKVEDWRKINGVPVNIGSVMRDFQLNVVNVCNNFIPTLSGINPAATQFSPSDTIYNMDVCIGDTIDFNVYAYDIPVVPAQNITMTWNNGIPNGSWSVTNNGTPNPTGHFYWLPNSTNASNTVHCFTVNIKDDACPYFGQQTFSYCFTVKGAKAKLDPPNDSVLCMGESYQIIAHVDADTSVIGYHWKVNGIQTSTPLTDSTFLINSTTLGAGIHVISCEVDYNSNYACPTHNEVIITVFPPSNTNLTVNDPTITANANNATYQWLDCDNGYAIIPGQTGQSFTSAVNGHYAVIIKQGRCSIDTSNCVQIISAGCSAYFTMVPDTTIQHHYYAINYAAGLSPMSYLWNWGDGNTSTGPYPSHTYASAGLYNICLTITDNAGCTNTYCDSSYLTKGTNTVIYVDVIPPGGVGIDETSIKPNISVFPNPATNSITFETSINNLQLQVYNLNGQMLMDKKLKAGINTIDITGFPQGMYFYRLTDTDKFVKSGKFVKE